MSPQPIANRCRHQQCRVRASCHFHHDFPPRGCSRDSFVGNFRGTQVEPARIEIRHELAGFDQPCRLAEHRAVVSAMLACEQRIQGEYSGDRCIGPAVSRLACLDLLQVCRRYSSCDESRQNNGRPVSSQRLSRFGRDGQPVSPGVLGIVKRGVCARDQGFNCFAWGKLRDP